MIVGPTTPVGVHLSGIAANRVCLGAQEIWTAPLVLDPDAENFIILTGATDIVGINDWVLGLKALDYWDYCICYPCRAGLDNVAEPMNAGSFNAVWSLGAGGPMIPYPHLNYTQITPGVIYDAGGMTFLTGTGALQYARTPYGLDVVGKSPDVVAFFGCGYFSTDYVLASGFATATFGLSPGAGILARQGLLGGRVTSSGSEMFASYDTTTTAAWQPDAMAHSPLNRGTFDTYASDSIAGFPNVWKNGVLAATGTVESGVIDSTVTVFNYGVGWATLTPGTYEGYRITTFAMVLIDRPGGYDMAAIHALYKATLGRELGLP